MSMLGKGRRPTRRGSPPGIISRGARAAGRMIGGAAAPGRRRMRFGRRRGITATELRGFNRVTRLLRKVGMVPKGTRRAYTRRK